MEQVVLVSCALAAQRAGGWRPWAGAHGIQDAAPPGLSSQPEHNFTIRANLNTVLLRVSESPWFNLPFAFTHTDEPGKRQALVAGSNADRLYSKRCCLGAEKPGNKHVHQKHANGWLLQWSRHCACLVTSNVRRH